MEELAIAYRKFLLELGEAFKETRDRGLWSGRADTFIDYIKSPEIGFSVAEVQSLIRMYDMFCLLEPEDLPSHHAMKIMASRRVDMEMLDAANTLSVTDFKEILKDKELGTQERTYKYEIIKRSTESGSINKVYGDELKDALKILNELENG